MLISIITPTHNRAEKLQNLFQSLQNQKKFNFEWIIVDDGSNDNTKEIIENFSTINFPIRYFYQKNSGKHVALNLAFKECNSILSIIVDDDDLLTRDATETIEKDWLNICQINNICGIVYRRKNKDGIIGKRFPKSNIIENYNNYITNKKISGDKAEVFKTDILKTYKFPSFKKEKFLGEGVLWSQISEKYNMLFVDKAIYICEYLPNGLTRNGRRLRIKNPNGGMYHAAEYLKKNFIFSIRFKNALLYLVYAKFARQNFLTSLQKQKDTKPLLLLAFLPSQLIYILWNNKYRR